MIIFLGDSFTWGQGLQYIHLTEEKGWTWEECAKIVPPNLNLEWLGFDEDEYRKKNAFPYLVAKEFNLPFQVTRFENGGDNITTLQSLQNMMSFCTPNNIFCFVIQCKLLDVPWVGVSWQPEIGDILKEKYPYNYIPIIYNGIEYTNFSTRHSGLADLFLTDNYPIKDDHFNLYGHKLIADLIINKMHTRNDLMNKLSYYKNEIQNKKTL